MRSIIKPAFIPFRIEMSFSQKTFFFFYFMELAVPSFTFCNALKQIQEIRQLHMAGLLLVRIIL